MPQLSSGYRGVGVVSLIYSSQFACLCADGWPLDTMPRDFKELFELIVVVFLPIGVIVSGGFLLASSSAKHKVVPWTGLASAVLLLLRSYTFAINTNTLMAREPAAVVVYPLFVVPGIIMALTLVVTSIMLTRRLRSTRRGSIYAESEIRRL